jgi:hypothetical protein
MQRSTTPTDLQLQIVNRLLSEDFPGRDELRQQLQNIRVENLDCEDKCPSFLIFPDQSTPKSAVKIRIPVEGEITDQDGSRVEILLHVVDGYLNELEIVKYEETDFIGPIDPLDVKVKVNDPKKWPEA